MLRLGALSVPLKDWWRTNRTDFVKRDSLVCDFSYTCAVTFKPIHRLQSILLLLLFVVEFPMLGLPMATLLDPCW